MSDVRARLVSWFAFLGPLGNLIPVPGVPHSFRFYYFLLPIGIVAFLFKGIGHSHLQRIAILSPVLVYVLASAGLYWLSGAEIGEEGNPMVRASLLVTLVLFTLLAAGYLQNYEDRAKARLLGIFLKGYFYSLAVGYVFFVGYYTGLFSLEFIENFQVLVQFGYGILRFSPGSYPNEYGIVSSFSLSLLTLLLFYRKQFEGRVEIFKSPVSTGRLVMLYILTLVALFLTTTRAAYIAYALSLVYLFLSQGNPVKSIRLAVIISSFLGLIFGVAQQFYDVVGIFVGGYQAFFDKDASAYERFVAWDLAYSDFLRYPFFGTGFGSADMIHNTYLQLFFGLGVVGFGILLISLLMLAGHAGWFSLLFSRNGNANCHAFLLGKAKMLAVIHVAWFAVSNHNLNHFLTWFCVLLVLITTSPVYSGRHTLAEKTA